MGEFINSMPVWFRLLSCFIIVYSVTAYLNGMATEARRDYLRNKRLGQMQDTREPVAKVFDALKYVSPGWVGVEHLVQTTGLPLEEVLAAVGGLVHANVVKVKLRGDSLIYQHGGKKE